MDYRFEADSMMKMNAIGGGAAAASPAIDSVISRIGQGSVVKNASNLAPLETYKVSGIYADSKMKLYSSEILVTLFILLIVIALVIFIVRRILHPRVQTMTSSKKQTVASQTPANQHLVLKATGISFISSLLILGFSLLVMFIFGAIENLYYGFSPIIALVTVVFSFGVFAVLLFIPGIYFGYKKGMGWGILTVILTLSFLLFYFIIGVTIFFFFGMGQQFSNPIMPMMGKIQY